MGSATPVAVFLAGAAGGAAGALAGALLNGANIGQIAKATFTGAFWGGVSAFLNFASADDVLLAKLFKHTFSQGWLEGVQGGNMFHGFLMGAVSSTGGHYIDKYAESLGKIGEISANAILSGTVDELGGGKFANGAITGAFSIMFNDMMHTKKKVKKAIKKELTSMIKYLIEMDGQLSLPEAYIWYKIGDGSGITVDASQINLNFVDVSSLKMNEEYGVQTWFGGLGQGLVYGGVTIQRKGANSVIIKRDKYNFEMHPWNSLGEVLRNIETIGADFLHGRGTPFDINFRGRNFIK